MTRQCKSVEELEEHRKEHACGGGRKLTELDRNMRAVALPMQGAFRKVLLQDARRQYWLFKPEQGDRLDSALVPEHAVAAARVASLLGVRTPAVTIAEYLGERGLLMAWDAQGMTLDDAVSAGLCSEEVAWEVLNAAGAVFDWVVGNGDRKLAHALVPHDAHFPPRLNQVSLIDLDMAFSPEEYGPDPPQTVTARQQLSAQTLIRRPELLTSQVATLLTVEEQARLARRLAVVAQGRILGDVGALHLF